MNAKLRKLLEDRAAAWSKVQDIQARREQDGYSPSDEDGETYTRALDDVERLSKQIEEEERAVRLSAVMDAPAGDQRSTTPRVEVTPDTEARYADAFSNYLRRGLVDLGAEDRSLLQARFTTSEEIRAAAAGTPAAGGYTVPTEFQNKLTETLKAFGGILGVAELLPTSSGAPIQWPSTDGTAIKGALLSENTAAAEQDETFANKTLAAYMFTSKLIRASLQFLQDSGIDANGFLARRTGERIGRALADYLVTGTGVSQPTGILTGLTLSVTSGTVGKVGYDDLIELEHKIDPAYRASGNARYVLADTALKEIRKLKDSQNRPLWVPSMAAGVPSTINGRPYTIDNSFPAFATAASPIIYGDIQSAFVVRVVGGAQVLRLTERFAEYLQVAFLGFQRFDSTVQDGAAAAKLTIG